MHHLPVCYAITECRREQCRLCKFLAARSGSNLACIYCGLYTSFGLLPPIANSFLFKLQSIAGSSSAKMGAGGQQDAALPSGAVPEPLVIPPVVSSNDLAGDPQARPHMI